MTTTFIEPLDVLFLRGNKLFGDAGSFGESLIPPWPSVAAGALRSAVLAAKGVDFVAFAAGKLVDAELGTPSDPGAFALHGFQLARKTADGLVERLYPMPADWIASKATTSNHDNAMSIKTLRPTALHTGLTASNPLPLVPLLAEATRSKAESGVWLTEAGWAAYLQDQVAAANTLVKSADLWRLDSRVGIGMNAATGSVAEGKLFTVQAIALATGVGFVADTVGVNLSRVHLLRFGGDGRGATCQPITQPSPTVGYVALAQNKRMKLVLTAPALFADGWLPNGVARNDSGAYTLNATGISATLTCAAVPRMEVASGWDLAQHAPKMAERVVPAGAVYWFDAVEASAEALADWVAGGLWGGAPNATRRAEGFNRFALAHWAA